MRHIGLVSFVFLLLAMPVFASTGSLFIQENERLEVALNTTHYVEVYAQAISRQGAVILINNQSAGVLRVDRWHTYPDHSQIYLKSIFTSDGGVDAAEFYLLARSSLRYLTGVDATGVDVVNIDRVLVVEENENSSTVSTEQVVDVVVANTDIVEEDILVEEITTNYSTVATDSVKEKTSPAFFKRFFSWLRSFF